MDKTDELILDLLKGNARMSFQELGDAIGMSRVAAKKRVDKLEKDGIIRGYNTCIYREDDITLFIDLVTLPEFFEEILQYVSTRTAYIRQIFRTSRPFHIQIIAVSDDVQNLDYLLRMIKKMTKDKLAEPISFHVIKEIIKDVYGGENKYGQRLSVSNGSGSDESAGGCSSEGEAWGQAKVQDVPDKRDDRGSSGSA